MTLTELKDLARGDLVSLWGTYGTPLFGVVAAKSPQGVTVHWDDGTDSTIWFRHAEAGFDKRHHDLAPREKGRFR